MLLLFLGPPPKSTSESVDLSGEVVTGESDCVIGWAQQNLCLYPQDPSTLVVLSELCWGSHLLGPLQHGLSVPHFHVTCMSLDCRPLSLSFCLL